MGTTESADRRGFIGGSDVAGILGLSPWSSPWSVWAEKTGGVLPDHSDEIDERLEIGKDAEQFLANVFGRHHDGIYVDRAPRELTNSRWPWLRGHADGLVCPIANGWEAKTTRDFAPWDEVPAYYQAQAQTYMLLSGLDGWWFTVGFAGWKVRHYLVHADRDDQALIAKATEQFWTEHVLTGIPPEADAHPATTEAIRHTYNVADPDDTLYADDELNALCRELRTVKADAKAIADRQAELENRIKARMADCGELRYGDQVLATWRVQTANRLDLDRLRTERPDVAAEFTTTSTSRVFRLKTPKGV